ncbi:tRNA adenosine(34) deaminase TadA [Paraburkholderia ferrariae]|uniref:tRNA adenosine(34) deaminase TadA n=1 Tax=Paraburkholderia ferrariae TaxID=386056 RepID=UPI003D18D178
MTGSPVQPDAPGGEREEAHPVVTSPAGSVPADPLVTASTPAPQSDVQLDPVSERDQHFMRLAQAAAEEARAAGEVPVGAVLVRGDEVIASGFNHPIGAHDPSAHAEMAALRAGAHALGNYRLPGCELYVTLEPCLMCAGAIMHARIARVVFGAHDPKTGACGSVVDAFANEQLNHHTSVSAGVLADECGEALRAFFADRRRASREARRKARAQAEQAQGGTGVAGPDGPAG